MEAKGKVAGRRMISSGCVVVLQVYELPWNKCKYEKSSPKMRLFYAYYHWSPNAHTDPCVHTRFLLPVPS